ncbi:hypothetical protein [Bacillus gobiensis]|uniref:hypothetical protein n=1 Tax=Bacillus gobiensis TaxID=1441095 RepID=UPI003D1F071A
MDLRDRLVLVFFTIVVTLLTNIVFKLLQNKFDFMVDTRKFKRDLYYQQLTNLYIEVYAMIAQSEFLRYFYDLKDNGTLEKIPFIEQASTKHTQKIKLFTGEILEEKREVIETALTEFNKLGLVKKIIDNKKYASQKLIKIVVAYRYCHEYYLKEDIVKFQSDRFKKEEVRLLHELVTTIIKECNEKLKYCKMDYIESEIKSGQMRSTEFEEKL